MSNAIANQLYLAYLGRPADTAWRASTTSVIAGATSPSVALQNAFYSAAVLDGTFSLTDSSSQLVNKIFLNVFGFAASTFEQSAWAQLITNGTITAQTAAWTIFSSYLGATNVPSAYQQPAQSKLIVIDAYTNALANDSAANLALTQLGSTAANTARTTITGITSQATAATAVTGITTTVSSLGTSTTGTTFTLTTSTDILTGTSANDTFNGVAGTGVTFGVVDSINGGNGTDTFFLQTDADVTISSSQVSNVEIININATAAKAVTLSGLTSVTGVGNVSSSGNLTISGIGTVGTASVSSVSAATTTLTYADSAVSGTADSLTLTLSGATGAQDINLNSATGDATGIETYKIVSAGSTNSVTLKSNDTNTSTINVSGSVGVTLALGTNITTNAKTIDASAATGNVSISGFGAAVHTVTGGSGADTFTFAGNFVGAENATAANRDTINGGTGRDTLSVTSAIAVAASAASQTTVTNVEVLSVSDAIAGNIDLTKFVGFDSLVAANATVGAHTFTFNTGSSMTFATGAAGNSARTFQIGSTGTTDALTITAVAGTDFGTSAQTFTGIETLNISTGTGTAGAAVVFGGALTATPTAGAQTTIVATGVNELTLTGVVTASTINASALTGVLTVSAAAANAISITGGSAADTINGSTAADLLVGGAGADSITGRAGNDILTGGAGADNFLQLTGVDNGIDSITDFTAGTGGDKYTISISATGSGTANNTIKNGNAATVTNGAAVGVKEVSAATTLAAADNVIVLTGTFSNAAAVQTAIETGGSRALTFASAIGSANDDFVIVWSDGTLGHISAVNVNATTTTLGTGVTTVTDFVTLTGITSVSAGQFVAANFAFVA